MLFPCSACHYINHISHLLYLCPKYWFKSHFVSRAIYQIGLIVITKYCGKCTKCQIQTNFRTQKLVDALKWRFSYISSSLLIQGLGTDEDTLNEILASRTNREIREINRVYREGKFNVQQSKCLSWKRKCDILFLKLSVGVN